MKLMTWGVNKKVYEATAEKLIPVFNGEDTSKFRHMDKVHREICEFWVL